MSNQVKIIVPGEGEYEFLFRPGQTVKEALTKETDGQYDFACGGQGRCGKCKMRALEGEFDMTAQDREFFSEEELKQGFRLACTAVIKGPAMIEYLGSREQRFQALSGFYADTKQALHEENQTEAKSETKREDEHESKKESYGVAIDVGTTTIAMNLLEKGSGRVRAVYTSLNRQRLFGADVLTRIQASNEGKGEKLRRSIVEDLLTGIEALIKKSGLAVLDIQEISIAGNTTMGHLLLGYSCETLGLFPFTPVDISAKTLTFDAVFGSKKYQAPVYFAPGITTFVGADVTAGLLSCGIARSKEVCMLIDLGTNGEMAIGNQDRILVASTAAGPAFEGGNISCGVGSVEGAVCDVHIEEGQVHAVTIGDMPMVGICGTGVIAITAALLEEEMIEPSGLLDEEYFDEGFLLGTKENGEKIVFTQKDVRELQLAKAAVRAGMETLIVRYGISKEEISKVYLAGGFGYKMDAQAAVAIGLLPQEMIGRVEAVGNSSLYGAAMALQSEKYKKELCDIVDKSEEISLSEDKDFQEFYIEYMMFGEE